MSWFRWYSKLLTDPDAPSITLLLSLYTLQGVPLGLAASVPVLLAISHVSYADQALFSLVSWPFSLKLLWAPIVDSCYISKFGRRKSWLIPIQFLIGILMLYLSININKYLPSKDLQTKPDIWSLTILFFILYTLTATQDIAVDGWALTLLPRPRVAIASICNSVGQTLGYFLSYVLFLALNSPEFCNSYLRSKLNQSEEGMINLPGFMNFWGWLFLLSTVLVWMVPETRYNGEPSNGEKGENETGEPDETLAETYLIMWRILRLPPVFSFGIILLTARAAFGTESLVALKLLEKGLPKNTLALLSTILIPISLVCPIVVSKWTIGPRPFALWLQTYPWRMVTSLCAALMLWFTPTFESVTSFHYCAFLALSIGGHVISSVMFSSQMAFFARVSDPRYGGTYMTLLNTLTNLGSNWPQTLALAIVDSLSIREKQTSEGEKPSVFIDGYYILNLIGLCIGVGWLTFFKRKITALSELPLDSWRINGNLPRQSSPVNGKPIVNKASSPRRRASEANQQT